MTSKQLLDLANRVEAGEIGTATEVYHALGQMALVHASVVSKSLDAAKALHDAVLPGWRYIVSDSTLAGDKAAEVEIYYVENGRLGGLAHGGSPAAAWVAAILRAKASEV